MLVYSFGGMSSDVKHFKIRVKTSSGSQFWRLKCQFWLVLSIPVFECGPDQYRSQSQLYLRTDWSDPVFEYNGCKFNIHWVHVWLINQKIFCSWCQLSWSQDYDYIVNWNLFPVFSIVFIINTPVKETNTNNNVCYFYWCSVDLSWSFKK